jgi:hypothetical protein
MLSRSHEQSKRFIKVIVDLAALAAQATGFVVWPLLEGREKPELWLIPLTVILISCGWWENYVNIPKDSHSSELRMSECLHWMTPPLMLTFRHSHRIYLLLQME